MEPTYLELKNVYSHKHSVIDFNFSSAVIVGQYTDDTDKSNGVGKSAILEGISLALFNKTRSRKKTNVIRYGCKELFVKYIYKMPNGNIYKIERRMHKVSEENEVVYCIKNSDGSWTNISGSTPTATNKAILQDLKIDYDTFINSVFFRQNDISEFCDAVAGRRKEILKSFLKISVWDKYKELASEKLKSFKAKTDGFDIKIDKFGDLESVKEVIETDLKETQYSRASVSKMLNAKVEDQQELNHKILLTSQSDIKDDKDILRLNKKHVSGLDTSITTESKLIRQKENRIDKLKQSIFSGKELLQSNKDILEKSTEELQATTESNYESKIESGRARIDFIKGMIKRMETAQLDDSMCPDCGTEVHDKDEYEDLKSNRVEEYKDKLARNSVKLAEIVARHNRIVELNDKVETANNSISSETALLKVNEQYLRTEKSELKMAVERLDKLEKEKEVTESKITKLSSLIKEKESVNVDDLQGEYDIVTKEINRLKANVSKLDINKGQLKSDLEKCLKDIDEKNEVIKNKKKSLEDMQTYKRLVKIFGKDGVPAVIVENIVGDLEVYSNNVLSLICNEPTQVSFVTKKKNTKGEMAETFDINVIIGNRVTEFEGLSGGEKFRLSFAIRVALSKILANRMGSNINFLLLDEVTSPLDKAGVRMFINTIKSLEKEFKIMIITHDDMVKNGFQDVITVEKTKDGAIVKQ